MLFEKEAGPTAVLGHVYVYLILAMRKQRILAQGRQGGRAAPELLLRASLMLSSRRAEASFDSCSCLSVAFLPGVKLESGDVRHRRLGCSL